MCKGSDIVKPIATLAAAPILAPLAIGKSLFSPPKMPEVVRTDPVTDQKKTETDAAQSAQQARLLQRRSAKRNSLLSAAGAVGDTSTADVSTPTAYGKPNLGG